MTLSILPVALGIANGKSIIALGSTATLGGAPLVILRLTASYNRTAAPGWPFTPAGVAAGTNPLVSPGVIPSGTTVTVTKAEADALLAAGVAVVA